MDYWNAITIVHEHEEGESRERCANCAIGRLIEGLTEFELFCFGWFRSNVSQFMFDAHLIGGLIDELGLKEMTKKLFLKALSMIYENDSKISQEKMRKDMEKKHHG